MKHLLITLLLFSCQEQELLSKPYPDTRQEVTQSGPIGSYSIRSITYNNGGARQWPLYCPLIHKRPINYGKPKY